MARNRRSNNDDDDDDDRPRRKRRRDDDDDDDRTSGGSGNGMLIGIAIVAGVLVFGGVALLGIYFVRAEKPAPVAEVPPPELAQNPMFGRLPLPDGQLWGVVGGSSYEPVKGAAFLVRASPPASLQPNTQCELTPDGLKVK